MDFSFSRKRALERPGQSLAERPIMVPGRDSIIVSIRLLELSYLLILLALVEV
jgi:hypothetical protein